MQTMHFHEADFEYIISRGMKYCVWHMAGPIWSLVGRKQARKCFPFSSGKKCHLILGALREINQYKWYAHITVPSRDRRTEALLD